MDGRALSIPFHRMVSQLARDPLGGLERIARDSDGAIVRLGLGLVRPYLVTHPDHVQQVLRDPNSRYARDGMLWKPLRRLNGNGIAGDGPAWAESRALFQSLFAAKHIGSLLDQMAAVVAEGVDALDGPARRGTPVNLLAEMTRIVHRVLVRVLFGDQVSLADAQRLGAAIDTAFASMGVRMVLPFVPGAIPMPGDRAFHRAVRTVDEIIIPLVHERLRRPTGGSDMVARICEARGADGAPRDARLVRDDLVAIFIAGTETTALALTWLWVVLDSRPDIAAKLADEVDRVVGRTALQRSHLSQLNYTKAVMQEVLRLYPAGWVLPRTVKVAHELGGVAVPAGAMLMLSPYLTHRSERFWPQPAVFDPERFAPGQSQGQHRFAYFPFGGGAHVCLGTYFYTVETQLIVAALLSRYRVQSQLGDVKPGVAPSLRPATPVEVILSRR
jgi:cytochrome P450